MKAFLTTTIAFCLFAFTCSAQVSWSTTTPNIYNLNTGNVGIGIGAPPTKLTVLDSVNSLQLRLGGVVAGLNPAMRWSGRNVANNANRAADIQLDADGGVFSLFAPANSTPVVKAINILMGGKVGIGTTAPGTAFDVLTTTSANGIRALNSGTLGTASGGGLLAANSSATVSASGQQLGMVGFGGLNSSSAYKYSSQVAGYASESWGGTGNGSYLTFSTTTNGAVNPTEKLRIDNNGNLGIGTTNPATALHVGPGLVANIGNGGGTVVQPQVLNSQTSGTAMLGALVNDGTDNYRMGMFADETNGLVGLSLVGSSGNPPFVIRNTTAEYLRIQPSGNVGIGTASPGTKLQVGGTLNNGGTISFSNGTAGYLGGSNTAVFGSTGTTYLASTSALGFSVGQGSVNADPTSVAMYINSSGKVGIGTANPDQKLTVNGQVHSTSVVVESTVPADYVFNADYNLRPLAEVKTFVDKNHHLPEVPSAAEFKKDGQNLGEMNMLLLKKVEELTLYMIEDNKQIKKDLEIQASQQKELTEAKVQIEKLQQQIILINTKLGKN